MQNTRPKKHSRASDRILIVSIFILLALLGGLATYLILSHKDKTVTESHTMDHSSMDMGMNHDTMTAKELIDATKDYMSKTFSQPVVAATGISPAYKPAGSPTYVATDTAPTLDLALSTQHESETTAAAAAVTEYIRGEHQLRVTRSASGEGMARPFAELQNDLLICRVEPLSGHVIVGCEDKARYTKLASDVAPFGDTFLKAQSPAELFSQVVFAQPQIKTSATAGYQTATLSQWSYDSYGGSAALFYKTPSSDWQYFAGTQSEMLCSQYDSVDLKKAYAGVSCLNASGQTTVK